MTTFNLYCCICDGPINEGEPVSYTETGIAHKFRTTCDWHNGQKPSACLDRIDAILKEADNDL